MAQTATKKPAAKKPAAKKVVEKKEVVKVAAPEKKVVAKKTAPKAKAVSEDLADLYVVTTGKLLATKRFKKHVSPVYGCEELYWSGKIDAGTVVSFVSSDKKVLPIVDCYNEKGGPGYTLDGEGAIAAFKVENALTITSNNGNQVYNYINADSKLVYVGDSKAHTIYVRIYDDVVGCANGRWVVITVD